MWALLVKIWALGSGLLGSLTRATTESRSDFTAIANVLQAELQRQAGIITTEIDRRERLRVQVDAMFDRVDQLSKENLELRSQVREMSGLIHELREENSDLRRQHVEDVAKILTLTDRVAYLESKEAKREPNLGGGI